MDKLTSINIEEGASAGNINGDSCLNCSSNSDANGGEGHACGKPEAKTGTSEQATTINAPEVHRAGLSSTTFVPKTDETTDTLDSGPQDSSNKSQENVQLRANLQRLNISGNQGRNNKTKGNGDTAVAPSAECLPKAIMSESLSNLLAYGTSSDDSDAESVPSLYESESDSEGELEESSNDGSAPDMSPPKDNVITTVGKYRETNSNRSDSESSDSDESSDTESDVGARSGSIKQTSKKGSHGDGEIGLDDLPPVPDLSKLDLNVKAEDCVQMGKVTSVVDRLVMIQSLPNTPAYDLDTLLFLDEGKRPLGHVYDVMGQVTSAMYVVRFNSKQEIESKGITKGLAVYSAPDSEHTQYVFLKQLMKMKGSDASWQGDNEVPQEFLDFSDDETEYMYSKGNVNEQPGLEKKRKRNSVEKHKMFETAMNLRNKVDTARHKMRDTYEPAPKRYVPPGNHHAFFYHPPTINQMRQQCGTSFTSFPPPNFATPPPNFGYVNMGPAMLGMPPFGSQFGHGMFAPNPQPFPPPAFGPPSIPPLPALPPHVMPQPQPPPAFAGNMAVMPPNMAAISVPKPQVNIPKSPKTPKTHHSGGVVPKAQPSGPKSRNSGLPKLYIPPHTQADYQPPYPPNLGLPKSTVPPFATNPPPNIPASMPPPFGPPMPPWPYNLPRAPHNGRGFQPHRGGGRPFKKQ